MAERNSGPNASITARLLILILGLGLGIRGFPPSNACTIFSVAQNGRVLAGNNEDFLYSLPSKMWIIPNSSAAYGRICFGWHSIAQGGMNDQGLFIDWAIHPDVRSSSPPAKPVFEGSVVERILANCATVDEALALFDKYAFRGNPVHFLVADKKGNSAVGEWINDKFKVIRKRGPHQILTNFLLSNPDLGNYPCSRFNTAKRMLEEKTPISVERCAAILDATAINSGGSGTKYSIVYDLANLEAFIFFQGDFSKPLHLKLEQPFRKRLIEIDLATLFEKGFSSAIPPVPTLRKIPSAREILAKALRARGGATAARKIQSYQASGTIDYPGGESGDVTLKAARPNKRKETVSLRSGKTFHTGFDGETGWENKPGAAPRLIEAKAFEQGKGAAARFAWLDDPKDYESMGIPSNTWFEGKHCYELKLTTKTGKEVLHYFDVESNLLAGIITTFPTQTGPGWSKTIFKNYREHNDFLFPTQIDIKQEGLEYSISLDSFRFNQVEEAQFDPPSELGGKSSQLKKQDLK